MLLLLTGLVAINIFWPATHHHHWMQLKRIEAEWHHPRAHSEGTASLELPCSWALPGSWTAEQRALKGLLQGNGMEALSLLGITSCTGLMLQERSWHQEKHFISEGEFSFRPDSSGMFWNVQHRLIWRSYKNITQNLRAADLAWDWRMNKISWGLRLSTLVPDLNINIRIYIRT